MFDLLVDGEENKVFDTVCKKQTESKDILYFSKKKNMKKRLTLYMECDIMATERKLSAILSKVVAQKRRKYDHERVAFTWKIG